MTRRVSMSNAIEGWERLLRAAIAAQAVERTSRDTAESSRGQRQSTNGSSGTAGLENLLPAALDENSDIGDTLLAASEVESMKNPVVARILTNYAYSQAMELDPRSEGRGVLQFKTSLHALLKGRRQEKPTEPDEVAHVKAIEDFFGQYNEYSKKLERDPEKNREKLAKAWKTARVLAKVLENISKKTSTAIPAELTKQIETTAAKAQALEKQKYNIVPLNITDADAPILALNEVKEAIFFLGQTDGLPRQPSGAQFLDIFELLQFVFGFQADSVANQMEHVVLMLANIQTRKVVPPGVSALALAINDLYDKVLSNFFNWASYVKVNAVFTRESDSDPGRRKLLFLSLYLLIWGEAANVRFMPECLCYLFYQMAKELDDILELATASRSKAIAPGSVGEPGPYAFLENIITPLYAVIKQEADYAGHGSDAKDHAAWRTYDDLNEFFWSERCLSLGWPFDTHRGFFTPPPQESKDHSSHAKLAPPSGPIPARRISTSPEARLSKTMFVEWRTFWHIFHSFDRVWIFLIIMLQAMVIIGFGGANNTHTLEIVSTIFPTIAAVKCLHACTDIMMCWGAYRSMHSTTVLRKLFRLLFSVAWAVSLTFFCVQTLLEWGSSSRPYLGLYAVLVSFYIFPRLIINIILRFSGLRKQTDKVSSWGIVRFIKWFYQEDSYVGRGVYESTVYVLIYSTFWIILFVCKFLFSYYYQVQPLITPTVYIIKEVKIVYQWHDLVSGDNYNALTLASLWIPVITIYLLDIQIWYTVLSAIGGGLIGAWWHLGEIRSLDMLRARFRSFPDAFARKLMPLTTFEKTHSTSRGLNATEVQGKKNAKRFAMAWNEIIKMLRAEDYLSNKDVDLLIMPSNAGEHSNIHWPLFLVANQIHFAMGLAAEEKRDDKVLENVLLSYDYMHSAVVEVYETVQSFLLDLVRGNGYEERIIKSVFGDIDEAIGEKRFALFFQLKNIKLVHTKLAALTAILVKNKDENNMLKAVSALQGLYETVLQDFLPEDTRLKLENSPIVQDAKSRQISLFGRIHWPSNAARTKRLHLFLTIKESALEVPQNLEARRRLQFFTNSLFMDMPDAPSVKKMVPFCVMTPYYSETVAYSLKQLSQENEDGISTLFYLQKIFPDEWANFLERINFKQAELEAKIKAGGEELTDLLFWASYRGQTLARTVRGMMYYHRALQLLTSMEEGREGDLESGSAGDEGLQCYETSRTKALADLKFTYVVTCQIYGKQKASKNPAAAEIFGLMKQYDALRVAYIDEVEVTKTVKEGEKDVDQKFTEYYSRLVKVDSFGQEQDIFKVKLPGPAKQGEGKPENQNHAIIFSRGDALQTIDMNQDNYLEEALKMRNLLEEFHTDSGIRKPTILGVREHVFTGSVSSLAAFMSHQETSFVTLGQRFLAYPLRVRMHYGHPDVFDRLFHITRGGISKASKTINISEDIYAGFNTTMRQGSVSHHEYIQVGKGRDVGLNQIALFEAKVASGNGEQMLSRDIYRMGQQFDFFRMMSFYFTSVGFYISTMLTTWCVYAFLYGKAYLALSGVEATLKARAEILGNAALESALSSQFLIQIGVFTAIPMIVVFIVERGLAEAIVSFLTMQLQLASVFFTFSLGTRTHYFGRTILHGGAKYRSTGRGFVVQHEKFAEIYRLFSRSHFVKGLEVAMLLIVYLIYGTSSSTLSYVLLTISSWFLVISWCFAPIIFNPSGFEWQKIVQDFDDWSSWLFYTGGIGLTANMSWESWWEEEVGHIRSIRSRFWEIVLSLRFFLFQYGIVYSLSIVNGNTSIWIYAISWIVLGVILLLFFVASLGQTWDAQLQVRVVHSILFFGILTTLVLMVIFTNLTVSDICASVLVFIPTGYGLLQIAIALRFVLEPLGLWSKVRSFARLYDVFMGFCIFLPVAVLSWFPFVSTFQSRLMFNQAFSRGLEISLILAGNNKDS